MKRTQDSPELRDVLPTPKSNDAVTRADEMGSNSVAEDEIFRDPFENPRFSTR